MSIFFIADLHLGHNNICNYEGDNRGNPESIEQHDDWIIYQWNSIVRKQDLIWVLGDVAFNYEGLHKLKRMNGSKHLILGNHDVFPIKKYFEYFNKIHGFMKYKGMWLSHSPIHPVSLRDKINIHGHTHSHKIDDDRYFCVSVEQLNGLPIELDEVFLRNNNTLRPIK